MSDPQSPAEGGSPNPRKLEAYQKEAYEALRARYPEAPKGIRGLFWDDYGLRVWACVTLAVLGGIVAVAALVGIIGGTALFVSQRSCASEAHGLGLAHKWGPFESCLLRTPGGQYIPDTQYFINHPQP